MLSHPLTPLYTPLHPLRSRFEETLEAERGAAAAFENAKHSDEEIIMYETGEHRSNDGQAMITLHDPSNALLIDETASDEEPQLLS